MLCGKVGHIQTGNGVNRPDDVYYGVPNMVEKPIMSDSYYKWKGSWKVRGGRGVIDCIFKDTPVCNITDRAAEGNRCYCGAYI
jgi:hypothetical protein